MFNRLALSITTVAGKTVENKSHPTMKTVSPSPEKTMAPFFDRRQKPIIPANSTTNIIDNKIVQRIHLKFPPFLLISIPKSAVNFFEYRFSTLQKI